MTIIRKGTLELARPAPLLARIERRPRAGQNRELTRSEHGLRRAQARVGSASLVAQRTVGLNRERAWAVDASQGRAGACRRLGNAGCKPTLCADRARTNMSGPVHRCDLVRLARGSRRDSGSPRSSRPRDRRARDTPSRGRPQRPRAAAAELRAPHWKMSWRSCISPSKTPNELASTPEPLEPRSGDSAMFDGWTT